MRWVDPKQVFSGWDFIPDGSWPNFHDAEILDLNLFRGDVRPELNRFIGPQITLKVALCAIQEPYVVILHFEDCESIKLLGFNVQNPIMNLLIGIEERGKLKDGSPMSPYICVHFLPSISFDLSFKCFRASILGTEPLTDTNCCH